MTNYIEKAIPVTEQKGDENTIPLVSISCITYNQENYIRDAIEGFLMQRTTFPVEILIHDDASTDKTPEIVREYENKYPLLIKPIYQTENQYSKGIDPGVEFLFPRARGKFIAICEGDDYWIDPLKLQKQVDYLEENQNVSFVASNFIIYNEATNRSKKVSIPNRINFEILLKKKNLIPTLTTCIKSEYLFSYKREIDPIKKKWPVGDYPLWLYLSLKGDVGIIPEYTANYNKRSNSVCHYLDRKKQYQFYLQVIDIARFYSTKQETSNSVKKIIKRNKVETLINYGYATKNKKVLIKWIFYYIYNGYGVPFKGIAKLFLYLLRINKN